jgi:hypothetical protein
MPTEERLWLNDEKHLLPSPHHPVQHHQEHPVRFGTGGSFHLSTKNNELLTEERVFCHEFGLASGKVCQRLKPGEKRCLVLSRRRSSGGVTEDKRLTTV